MVEPALRARELGFYFSTHILLKLLSRALLDIAETWLLIPLSVERLRKQTARWSMTALLPHAVHVTVIQAFEYAVAAALHSRLSPYAHSPSHFMPDNIVTIFHCCISLYLLVLYFLWNIIFLLFKTILSVFFSLFSIFTLVSFIFSSTPLHSHESPSHPEHFSIVFSKSIVNLGHLFLAEERGTMGSGKG